jgi:hypothetical protein
MNKTLEIHIIIQQQQQQQQQTTTAQLLHNHVPTVDCPFSRSYRHSDVGVLRTAEPEL